MVMEDSDAGPILAVAIRSRKKEHLLTKFNCIVSAASNIIIVAVPFGNFLVIAFRELYLILTSSLNP